MLLNGILITSEIYPLNGNKQNIRSAPTTERETLLNTLKYVGTVHGRYSRLSWSYLDVI